MTVEGEGDHLESLVVFADAKVVFDYPLCCFRPDEFIAGPSVRLILVSKIENSYLGAVPQSAWDRLVAKRALPRNFLSKAVRVLVKNCREDDRSSAGDTDSVIWLGFIGADFNAAIDLSNPESEAVEIDFGEDPLPYADALVHVAQDHFAFFSAEEGPEEVPAQESGSEKLAERVGHLEIMIQNLNSTLANLVPTTPGTPRVTFADAPPPAVAQKLPSPKTKARTRTAVPRREVPRPRCGGCQCSPTSWRGARCFGRDASSDGQESEGGQVFEANSECAPRLKCAIGKRGRRGRRAWISRWLLRSRCYSSDEADEDCGASIIRQEEACWCLSFGDSLRWSTRWAWWRILILIGGKEICNGKADPSWYIAGFARRDFFFDREAHGRGCAVSNIAAGTIPPELHCSWLGGAQVEDWPLQSSGACLLGHSWSAGSAEERKYLSCKSKMLPDVVAAGSELCGQRKLGFGQRAESRSATTLRFFIPTPGSVDSRRRPALFEVARPKVGRSGIGSSERSGRLHSQTSQHRQEGIRRPGRSSITWSEEGCKIQSEGEGRSCGRQSMMPGEAACPQQLVDNVPVDASNMDTMLPGARASTVVPAAVANSLFRWVLNTQGAFRSFLLSIVTMPKDRNCCPTSSPGGEVHVPIWPMPVPYPEVFTKKVDSGKEWWKSMICMQVLALSWLVLGEPHAAPMEIRMGVPLTPQQWSVVSMLRRLSFDSNTPEFIDSNMMSRAAAKFESMEDTIGSLHRSLLACDDGGYFGPRFDKAEEFDDTWMRSGSLIGRLQSTSCVGAKPVIASRLEFPAAPSFDPVPFFDAETAELFIHPLDHAAKPQDFVGSVPTVSVHGSRSQKVELFKKLANCKRLEVVDPGDARDPFVSGLFAVGKNSLLDRLILDARPPNLLEASKSVWCGTMASCSGLADLTLEADEVLCCSGLDLKDFFYQFVVSPQRIVRNTLAGSISPAEAAYVFGREFDEGEGEVRVALATLAMGDLLACEFSQSAHLSLCLRHHVMNSSELLTLRTPVPRSKVVAGVIIDDLVVMEKLVRDVAEQRMTDFEGACDRIKSAVKGYAESSLEANIKKSFFNETSCRFWGGEVDGKAGLVRASSLRAWPLAVITMKVAMLGFSSVKLLETLAGAWISVLSMRRRMFCILDIIFEPLGIPDGNQIVALSPALQDEMCILSSTFLLAVADLRADFLPMVSATDASGEFLAAVRAPLPATCASEFSRHLVSSAASWESCIESKRFA